jgi:NAD+ synthase (glutamine-hydrolysing)
MPGFGTSERTRSNANRLMELTGVTLRTIPITEAVRQHFKDIGHDETVQDITYENAQARERTQILMDVANQIKGLVLGTGDLSEAALGWCTFNADHMSMYNVNTNIPKTLVRYVVEWCADNEFEGEARQILHDIVATPVSPELVPPAEGEEYQSTEVILGPYELHDFFLFQTVRHQFSPEKIFYLARIAFDFKYPDAEIVRVMKMFYRRFFANQFKRSSMPDGPKIGSLGLSPRGYWRMPSDMSSALWMKQIADLEKQFCI